MGISSFDDAGLANWARAAASQDIEIDRGSSGRARVSDPV
jgi:hypothetical protein